VEVAVDVADEDVGTDDRSGVVAADRGGEGRGGIRVEVALHELPHADDVPLRRTDRRGDLAEAPLTEVREVLADHRLGVLGDVHLPLLAEVLDLRQQRLRDGS
jgi:hypothetical protein